MNLFEPIKPSNNLFQPTNNYNNTWQQQPSSVHRNPSPMQPGKNINGSYRGIFKQVKLDYLPPDPNAQGPAYSTTIISQPEYKGMTLLMVRLEDYFLIRSQQIDSNHKNLIQRACMQNRFDQKLIANANIQNLIPPNFPNQQSNRSTWNGYQNNTQTNNVFQQNNSQNNYQNTLNGSQRNPQTNTNIFQNNTSTPNLFQSQTQNNTNMWAQPVQNTSNIFSNNQNNVFQSNPYQQTQQYQTTPQQNIFQQPQQQQQNLFQQPQQMQNPFSQPQQQMNLFQSQQQPNIFNNQPANIFSQPLQPPNIFQQPLQGGYNMMNNNNNMWMQKPMYPMMMPINNSQMFQSAPVQIVEESVKSFLDYASMMAREYQRYVELKEIEQFNSEQQEIIIRENERIQQMERMEREKKYTQKLEKQYKGNYGLTRSPSPYSSSRISNSTHSQRQSHISINHTYSRENSPFRKSMISVTRSTVQNGKQLNIHIKFAESDNYYYQQVQKISSTYQSVHQLKLDIIKFLQEEKILTQDLSKYRQYSKLYTATNVLLDDNLPTQDLPSNLTILIHQGKLPNLMKPGYSSEPTITTLDENNLFLSKFKIYNKYGSAEWENVDISYINFDKIVDIQDCEVTVYDEAVIHPLLKPQQGDKLNKDCIITCSLNKFINVNQTPNIESIETKLIRMVKEIPAAHYIGINQENLTFQIEVEHFTKYNFTEQFNDNFADSDDSYLQNQHLYRKQLVEANFSDDENHEVTIENDGIVDQSQSHDQMEIEFRIKEAGQKLEYFNEQFMEQQQQQQQQPNINKVELIRIKLFNERMQKEKNSNYPFQENKKFPLGSPFDYSQKIEISESISKYFGKMKLNKSHNSKNQITERIIKIFQSYTQIREQNSLKLINILFGNSCVDLQFYAQLLRFNEQCKIEDLNELNLDTNHLVIPAFQKWFDELSRMSRQFQGYEQKLSSIEKVLNTTNKSTQYTEKDWRIAIFESCTNVYSEDWWKNIYMQLQVMQISNLNQLILEIYLTIKFGEPISGKILKYLNNCNDQFVLILMHIILLNRKDNLNKQTYRTIIINKISQLRENAEVIFEILDMFEDLIFGEQEYLQLQQQIGKQFGAKQSRIKSEQITGLIYEQDFEKAAQIAYENNLKEELQQICEQFVLPILVIENRDEEVDQMMEKCNELGIYINLRELEVVNLYQYHMKLRIDKNKYD